MKALEIMCSCCGSKVQFVYTATNVINAVKSGWSSYGSAFYCPECSATWEERNGKDKKLSTPATTIYRIDELYKERTRKNVY